MSRTVQIELTDEVCAALHKDPDDLVSEMRVAAAAKWYELGLISQEKAAMVAGLSRARFIAVLSRFAVSPFQETAADALRGVE